MFFLDEGEIFHPCRKVMEDFVYWEVGSIWLAQEWMNVFFWMWLDQRSLLCEWGFNFQCLKISTYFWYSIIDIATPWAYVPQYQRGGGFPQGTGLKDTKQQNVERRVWRVPGYWKWSLLFDWTEPFNQFTCFSSGILLGLQCNWARFQWGTDGHDDLWWREGSHRQTQESSHICTILSMAPCQSSKLVIHMFWISLAVWAEKHTAHHNQQDGREASWNINISKISKIINMMDIIQINNHDHHN